MTNDQKFELIQSEDEAEVLGLKTKCPQCQEYTEAKDSFFNEPKPELGSGIEIVGVRCGNCNYEVIAYYTDRRLRQSTLNLRKLRERVEETKYPIQQRLTEYNKARTKHKKYFDRLQRKLKNK